MTVPIAARGRGAFSSVGRDNGSDYYEYIVDKPKDGSSPEKDSNYEAVWYGVKAIQTRTNEILHDLDPLPVEGLFGPATSARVKMAQKALGLEPTGIFGKETAKAYWKPVITEYAAKYDIPAKYLWGEMLLESAADPGAVVGSDRPYDLGLMQINVQAHKEVSNVMAFDYRFAIDWAALHMAKAMGKYKGKPELQIQAAILSHNTPVGANAWYETGKPPSDKATRYVNWVLERAETY